MNKIDELELSIKQNLFEAFAKDFENARYPEIYTALAASVRQLVGEKWFHSLYDDLKSKRLYILSFEYTLGDNLLKNLVKLNLYNEAKEILSKHNIKIADILNLDIEFALGFGDLGIVSGYSLEYLSKFHKNIYAYGLRYRNGMLKQEIVDGAQIEKPDDWRVNDNPWEHEKGFNHRVNFKNFDVKAIPYDIPIVSSDADNVSTLRLWKSFSTEDLDFEKFSSGKIHDAYKDINRANSIVEFLYPSEENKDGRKLRLKQEYFFASASIQDILKKYKKYVGEDISNLPEYATIQIHDVHPTLAILVFIELVMQKYNYTFNEAYNLASRVFVYMQLSILPEIKEKWDISLIAEVCPNLIDVINEIDTLVKGEVKSLDSDLANDLLIIKNGKLDSINLLYSVCKKIISITPDHMRLLKSNNLARKFKYYEDKFVCIDQDFDAIQYYKERQVREVFYAEQGIEIAPNDIRQNKKQNKEKLIKSLNVDPRLINLDSAFIMQLGNFHEYKRQLLSVLSIALTYMRLKKNPNLDIPERTYFFAGKSYPNYYIAKEIIKFINALSKLINNDLFIKDKIKIVFIENYNLAKSNLAIPASDIYLNLELLSMESNNISVNKAIASASKILSAESNYEESTFKKNDIDIQTFGRNIDDVLNNYIYNVNEFLNKNGEIREMFDFYRYIQDANFNYDVNKIIDNIVHYNDGHNLLLDLYDFTDKLELMIKEYSQDENWYQDLYNNSEKLINKPKEVEKYIEIME